MHDSYIHDREKKSWNILELLKWTTSYFKTHSIESSRASAEILLAQALQIKRIDLYLNYDQPLISAELKLFKSLIKRRIKREPVAYIVGSKEFWSLPLTVNPTVLIPRPETECLVEALLNLEDKSSGLDFKNILDLGTGSGAVVLALAHEKPQHIYFASDKSFDSICLARQNALALHLEKNIIFLEADWFEPFCRDRALFDIIISNPPYIPTAEISHLEPEIYQFEPKGALDGGQDGLTCLTKIIEQAPIFLKPGGYLLLEIGYNQKEALNKIIKKRDAYHDPVIIKDYSGLDRVIQIKKKDK